MKTFGKLLIGLASGLIPGLALAAAAKPPGDCVSSHQFEALRRCAQQASWVEGRLDESVAAYKAYLASRPGDAKAWLEYAQVEIWRGDYGAADKALEHYRSQLGEDDAYRAKLARLLARAEWPDAAAAINDPLLAANPKDYNINYTHTLILRADHRPDEAVDSLQTLHDLRPDSKDTADMTRFVHTPVRSHIRASFSYYDDSDDISIRHLGLDGRYVFGNKRTALLAGYDDEHLKAKLGSGLETYDGRQAISFNETWVGVEHRWSPWLQTTLRTGSVDINGGDSADTNSLSATLDPLDKLTLRLGYKRALYDISPRAVSYGIMQTAKYLNASWRPDLYWTLDAQLGSTDFSDDNSKQQLVLSPHRAVLRQEHFKLDLGVSGEWFSFDRDLNHGYYDPDQYRRYAFTAFGYWKIDDDNGIGTSLSLGWHKDNNMSSYDFGEDVSVEGYFGIFRDWYLILRGGYVERYNTVGNYDGLMLSGSLMRRF